MEKILFIMGVSLIESYATFCLLFPNFSVGWYPVVFVILMFVILGLNTKLEDLLVISVISPIVSFFLLQVVSYFNFRSYATYNILLTVLARGAVGFGIAWMLIGTVVGSFINLLFKKGNGSSEY
jgi:hypothetical protein